MSRRISCAACDKVPIATAGSHVIQERDAVDPLHGEPPLAAMFEELAERDEVGVLDIVERA